MRNNTTGNMVYESPDNLRAAIDGIDSYLNSLPIGDDLRGLNALYGNMDAAQDAFTLGQQVVTRRNIVAQDVPDITAELRRGAERRAASANSVPASQQVINDIGVLLGDDLSQEVLNAFVDGARFQLYSTARTSRDPARALSEARMEDFRAIVGDDIADAMASSIEDLFAARRQLGQTQDLTTTPPRRQAVQGEALMTPARGTAADLVARTQPGTSRSRPAAVGGLAAYGGVEGGEPAQQTTDSIRAALGSVPAVLRDAMLEEWAAMNRR